MHMQVWQQLQVEKLGAGNHSYLITWRGSNPALKPALFISHVDVVPVSPGTEQDWTHPPFGGAVADGFIWGKPALQSWKGFQTDALTVGCLHVARSPGVGGSASS